MRGLIEKDLRLTLARKQTILIFFVMALIMGASMDGSFLIAYLTMLATILAVGTISYDEFDNGFAFLMTLPFDRKTYVREKYLFCLMMAAAAWCIGAALYGTVSFIRHNAINLVDELPMLTALIPVLYLSAAVMIPLQLKYGSERSRIAFLILFGVIAILLYAAKNSSDSTNNPFMKLSETLDALPPAAVLAALAAACALIVFASYRWSLWIMKMKEF
ncbi:MAG: ABC-2 transporter permease [Oscillospiraceae bacterium]|nr:ABC-2 transporter permease [Oscillospiraceae bacterium]